MHRISLSQDAKKALVAAHNELEDVTAQSQAVRDGTAAEVARIDTALEELKLRAQKVHPSSCSPYASPYRTRGPAPRPASCLGFVRQ